MDPDNINTVDTKVQFRYDDKCIEALSGFSSFLFLSGSFCHKYHIGRQGSPAEKAIFLSAFGHVMAGKEGNMIKRNYKDTLFISLFGSAHEALELYNALNGTDYKNENDIEITTLENAMYLGFKNDVSFLLFDELNLYEHQSTENPNMPLRGLFYFTAEYQKIVEERQYNIYGSRRIELPAPRYVVLCNAEDMKEERTTLRLSELYNREIDVPCLECTAEVININKGHNEAILNKSITLNGYAELVFLARKYRAMETDERTAAEKAIDECVDSGILSDYLQRYRSEVVGMILEEYDAEKQRKLDRRDAYAEGKAEGKAEDRSEAVMDFLADLGDVPDDIKSAVMEEKDMDRLKKMMKGASRAGSFDEFRAKFCR
jgi:hypothetical protein